MSDSQQATGKNKGPISTNIRVIARFRPLIDIESEITSNSKVISFVDAETVALKDGTADWQQFSYDHVFDGQSTQEQVFDIVGKPICQDIVNGYNGTVFAYGQTGSGKTHSMMGEDLIEPETRGIVPRCATFFFDWVEDRTDSKITITVSLIEIYKEMIRDLLNPQSTNLEIKQSASRGIFVNNLEEVSVVDEDDFLEVIALGQSQRTVAATKMNKQSSRSHQIIMIEVEEKYPDGSVRKGCLNLVDLAGSEKIAHTGVTGKNLEEAKKINLSLSALGNVIKAMVKKQAHIPYRDSKLTRLLEESLGGNYKTTLIVAASPHPNNFDDTLNTLKFAQRAKTIKTKAKVNMNRSPAEYMRMINKLKEEVSRLKEELKIAKTASGVELPVESPIIQQRKRLPSIIAVDPTSDPFGTIPEVNEDLEVTLMDQSVVFEGMGKMPSLISLLEESDIFSQLDSSSSLNFQQFGQMLSTKQEELVSRIQSLENEVQEKKDKINDLEIQLEDQKRQTEKKASKLRKFVENYKEYSEKMESNRLAEHLKCENKSLAEQIQVLKNNMRVTNIKYKNLIAKSRDAGVQFDMAEFEVKDVDDILDTNRTMLDQNVSINEVADISYIDVPLYTKYTNPYDDNIAEILGNQSYDKDRTIYDLKNKLMDACLHNYNVSRSLQYLQCKQYLTDSRRLLIETRSTEQGRSITALEELLDTLYSTLTHVQSKLAAQPAPSPMETPQPEGRPTRSSMRTTTRFGAMMRQNQGAPSTLRRRTSRLGLRSTQMPVQPFAIPQLPLAGGRAPTPAFGTIYGGNPNIAQGVPGIQDPADMKFLEAQIKHQQLYNINLVKQNEILKNEMEMLNATVERLESRMKEQYKHHFDAWEQLITDYRQNCDFQLGRKQAEVDSLSEALVKWVREYKSLERKIGSKAGNLGEEYQNGLMKLQLLSPSGLKPGQSDQLSNFAPRLSSSLYSGRGDSSPPAAPNDDF